MSSFQFSSLDDNRQEQSIQKGFAKLNSETRKEEPKKSKRNEFESQFDDNFAKYWKNASMWWIAAMGNCMERTYTLCEETDRWWSEKHSEASTEMKAIMDKEDESPETQNYAEKWIDCVEEWLRAADFKFEIHRRTISDAKSPNAENADPIDLSDHPQLPESPQNIGYPGKALFDDETSQKIEKLAEDVYCIKYQHGQIRYFKHGPFNSTSFNALPFSMQFDYQTVFEKDYEHKVQTLECVDKDYWSKITVWWTEAERYCAGMKLLHKKKARIWWQQKKEEVEPIRIAAEMFDVEDFKSKSKEEQWRICWRTYKKAIQFCTDVIEQRKTGPKRGNAWLVPRVRPVEWPILPSIPFNFADSEVFSKNNESQQKENGRKKRINFEKDDFEWQRPKLH